MEQNKKENLMNELDEEKLENVSGGKARSLSQVNPPPLSGVGGVAISPDTVRLTGASKTIKKKIDA